MAANGRGAMRPQSRSPPFLVIGLLVALVILGANYWSLSSNNSSLGQEVAELQDQVRLLSAKRISAEKKIDSMAESYNKNKDALAQKESDVKGLGQQLSDKTEQLQTLTKDKGECVENLKNCQENSNGIQQELQKVKEELDELKRKEQARTESTPKCDEVCNVEKKMLLAAVEKTLGINSVQALHNAGVEVFEYKDKFGAVNKDSLPNQSQGVPGQTENQQQAGQQPQGVPPQGQVVPPQGQGLPLQGQVLPPQGQGLPPQSPLNQGQPSQGQQVQGLPGQGQTQQPQVPGHPQQNANNQFPVNPSVDTKQPVDENQNKDDKVNVNKTTPMSVSSSPVSMSTKTSMSTQNASISGLKEAMAADKDYNQEAYDDDDDAAETGVNERLKFQSQKDIKSQDDSIDKLRRKMDQVIQQK